MIVLVVSDKKWHKPLMLASADVQIKNKSNNSCTVDISSGQLFGDLIWLYFNEQEGSDVAFSLSDVHIHTRTLLF